MSGHGGAAPRGPIRRGPGGPHGMVMPGERSIDFRGSGSRLLRVLHPERWRLTLVGAVSVVSVALSVAGPKLLGLATDAIFAGLLGRTVPAGTTTAEAVAELRARGEHELAEVVGRAGVVPGQGVDFGRVGTVLLAVVAVYVLSALLSYVAGWVTTGVVQRTVHGLRAAVETKIARLPLRYFDRQPRGEVLSRVTNDIDNIAQTLQQTINQLITALLTVVGVLAMMVWISPLLALVALVAVPLSGYVTVLIAKRSQPQFAAQWRWTGELNAHIEEMYTGHELVTVFGRQQQAQEIFDERNEHLYRSAFKAQFISGTIHPAMMFIGNLTYVGIAVVGGLRVMAGAITLGDVQAFIQYSRQFSHPIVQVASMMNLLQSGVASAERVFELLDEEEQSPDPTTPVRLGRARGRVVFEDVSFRYEPDTPLIEDLSLVAEPGQTVAIVGPTGAGKTTLVNLLMRFYEVDSGRITLDGVDITDLTRDELRSQMGMVLQDTWLFSGTIAENIAYGVDGATQEQIEAAARATHVDRFVRTLPDGYETVIDDEGANVSAGERQLLTIARAFLADPAILILDEATSSVDTRTEVLVQEAMGRLRSGRTSFVIAHRLSTIRDADVILVMEDGAIVEQGTHEELLAAEGAYARLYQSQFAAAAAPVE